MSRLRRVLDSWYEYQRLCEKVEQLIAVAEKTTQQISGMPLTGGQRMKDDTWAALIDYKASCEWKLEQYYKNCRELEDELEIISNPEIRIAMKYKYIDGLSARLIAEKMHFEERSVYRLLKKGRQIYDRTYGS